MEKSKKTISGFSKLSKTGKIKWIVENFFKDPEIVMRELKSYWHINEEKQKILDGFSENTISNFPMPYGVAPNVVINGKTYCVPMVIEESSVVAAASSAAKYWMSRGGFKAEVLNMEKIGQVHFKWGGSFEKLEELSDQIIEKLKTESKAISTNMDKRGGGLLRLEFIDFSDQLKNCYQLRAHFDTCDSMGANFINSMLEQFGESLQAFFIDHDELDEKERDCTIIMAILSNYTPSCLVKAWVECPIEEISPLKDMPGEEFAWKFCTAVKIAKIDPYRATTHNKGIFNGIDAVVLATGNDFRAIEACGHTYASKDGQYRSLSDCEITDGMFKFSLTIPLAIGTIGGLTSLHPMAKRSLELLENPNAEELMKIIATIGLAQNFGAVRSLVTTGIQYGHMKMHLSNILNHLQATEKEMKEAIQYFKEHTVSFSAVRSFLDQLRKGPSKILS